MEKTDPTVKAKDEEQVEAEEQAEAELYPMDADSLMEAENLVAAEPYLVKTAQLKAMETRLHPKEADLQTRQSHKVALESMQRMRLSER